jgi:uncharacterized protein (AIM24 family)
MSGIARRRTVITGPGEVLLQTTPISGFVNTNASVPLSKGGN